MDNEIICTDWLKKIDRMMKCYKIYSFEQNETFFQQYTRKIHAANDLFSIINEYDGDEKIAVLVTGAIGSGKSTFLHNLLIEDCIDNYIILSPDIYLHTFFPKSDYLTAYNSTKKIIQECYDKCQLKRMPFIVEMVPAKDAKIDFVKTLRDNNFFIVCFFLKTSSVECNFARINKRVDEGAFSIPNKKVISRFLKSDQNIQILKKLSDIFFLVDTSYELPKVEEQKWK